MSLTADIGKKIRLTLTDGRVIEARLTFGDFARAEIESGVNYLTLIAGTGSGAGDVSLNDLAMLCYQAATRTGQYEGAFDEWLLALDDFPDIETDEGEGVVAPFPESIPATS